MTERTPRRQIGCPHCRSLALVCCAGWPRCCCRRGGSLKPCWSAAVWGASWTHLPLRPRRVSGPRLPAAPAGRQHPSQAGSRHAGAGLGLAAAPVAARRGAYEPDLRADRRALGSSSRRAPGNLPQAPAVRQRLPGQRDAPGRRAGAVTNRRGPAELLWPVHGSRCVSRLVMFLMCQRLQPPALAHQEHRRPRHVRSGIGGASLAACTCSRFAATHERIRLPCTPAGALRGQRPGRISRRRRCSTVCRVYRWSRSCSTSASCLA